MKNAAVNARRVFLAKINVYHAMPEKCLWHKSAKTHAIMDISPMETIIFAKNAKTDARRVKQLQITVLAVIYFTN